jgi:hypothetical protein
VVSANVTDASHPVVNAAGALQVSARSSLPALLPISLPMPLPLVLCCRRHQPTAHER